MSDTRRAMTRAAFEEEAGRREPRWWQTGEAFIHHAGVQQVDGWQSYGAPGNLQLTEAQRVLMIWSDLVGQVANGGIAQFAENLEAALPVSESLLPQLQWPELDRQLTPALAEQKAFLHEQQFREHWFTFSDGLSMVARQRSAMIDRLAKVRAGLNPFKRSAEKVKLADMTNDALTELFDAAVDAGKLKRPRARSESSMDMGEEPDAPASEAFDDWLYQEETKAASQAFVGDFIRRRADELVRFTD